MYANSSIEALAQFYSAYYSCLLQIETHLVAILLPSNKENKSISLAIYKSLTSLRNSHSCVTPYPHSHITPHKQSYGYWSIHHRPNKQKARKLEHQSSASSSSSLISSSLVQSGWPACERQRSHQHTNK